MQIVIGHIYRWAGLAWIKESGAVPRLLASAQTILYLILVLMFREIRVKIREEEEEAFADPKSFLV